MLRWISGLWRRTVMPETTRDETTPQRNLRELRVEHARLRRQLDERDVNTQAAENAALRMRLDFDDDGETPETAVTADGPTTAPLRVAKPEDSGLAAAAPQPALRPPPIPSWPTDAKPDPPSAPGPRKRAADFSVKPRS